MLTKYRNFFVLVFVLILIFLSTFIYFDNWAKKLLPGFTKNTIIPVLTFAELMKGTGYKTELNNKDLDAVRRMGLKDNDAWVIAFAFALQDSFVLNKNATLPKFAIDLMRKDALHINTDSIITVGYSGENRVWDSSKRVFVYNKDKAIIRKQGDDITVILPLRK